MTRSFDASHTDLSASGAWPLWSWVSDDRPALGLRSGPVLWEFSSCPLVVSDCGNFVMAHSTNLCGVISRDSICNEPSHHDCNCSVIPSVFCLLTHLNFLPMFPNRFNSASPLVGCCFALTACCRLNSANAAASSLSIFAIAFFVGLTVPSPY